MTDHPTPAPTREAKPQITAGGALAALVPQNIDEAFRISQALASSGDMVPKHFQGKPNEIMAAIMRGAEVGLMPMQALSNIAVINGKATLYGDGITALIRKAGHEIDCIVEGDGDGMKAVATLTRGDTGREIVREFSVADAKKAGLWGKAGPWQNYSRRMLYWRALSWACRDGAADALMGLQVAEEMQDIAPIRDVTPKETGFAARARQARQPEQPATATESAAGAQVEDAEVVTAADPREAILRNTAEQGFPGSDAWTKGEAAFAEGKPLTDCPYEGPDALQETADWAGGWVGAEKAAS